MDQNVKLSPRAAIKPGDFVENPKFSLGAGAYPAVGGRKDGEHAPV